MERFRLETLHSFAAVLQSCYSSVTVDWLWQGSDVGKAAQGRVSAGGCGAAPDHRGLCRGQCNLPGGEASSTLLSAV